MLLSNLICAVIRRTLLTAHRQAWCWQDEWVGLDLAAVRQLESETRLALARVMHEAAADQSASATGSSSPAPAPNAPHTSTSPKASPKKSAKESPKQSPKHKTSSGARGAEMEADGQLHNQGTSNGAYT